MNNEGLFVRVTGKQLGDCNFKGQTRLRTRAVKVDFKNLGVFRFLKT